MPTLEFELDPADAAKLARHPGIHASRTYPLAIVWHDTPTRSLAAQGQALTATGKLWRLLPLRPESAATPATPLAEAKRPELLPAHAHPDGLTPIIAFQGTRRALRWTAPPGTPEGSPQGSIELRLIQGSFPGSPPLCRLTLDGPAPAALATTLAATLRLKIPRASLDQLAQSAATGQPPPPRALGAPTITPGQTVGASLGAIVAHLTDVMLHWAHQVPTATTPEPVHQMRVATRRLRSALSIYKPLAPSLATLSVPLRICASRLGTARDWDVFLGGLGARIATAFPDDKRCAAMIRAGQKRRRETYVDLRTYLEGPDFRTLAITLACTTISPSTPEDPLSEPAIGFARIVLEKRMKRVRQAGRKMRTLSIPALHELRKDCKRLRYAAEFFAALFAPKRTRRFLSRLAALQEELGLLNDGAAVSSLMAQMGRLERSYAAGLVEGFSAAHAGPARARIEANWKQFQNASPFWEH